MIFQPFPKMARLKRPCIVTEKIDGTNASVLIDKIDQDKPTPPEACFRIEDRVVYAGSRTRWITPTDDNFGFAQWVYNNAEQILKLPLGHHFGEWWGSGIQRNYGQQTRHFSLFNVSRFHLFDKEPQQIPTQDPRVVNESIELPPCIGLVPVLIKGVFDTRIIDWKLDELATKGSVAAPGFMKPEGIVVYHVAGNVGFKRTIEKDDQPKNV